MKITVQNLGAITEAEIDIEPLTVFVGPNNTGKTWLAYTVAGIFGPDRFTAYASDFAAKLEKYPPLDRVLEQALEGGSVALDIVDFAEKYGETYINEIAHSAREWMPIFMHTRLASFENLNVSIKLAKTKTTFLNRILNTGVQYEFPFGKNIRLNIRKKRGERELYIYSLQQTSAEETSTEPKLLVELPPELVKDVLGTIVLQIIHRAFYRQVRILPTERTTALTLPIIGQSAQLETLTVSKESSEEWNTKALIGPVNTYFTMLRTHYDVRTRGGKIPRTKPVTGGYARLARLLEEQILDGKVEFTPLESSLVEESKQLELGLAAGLVFQTTLGTKLEISIASSMVKELAPLVLYLRDIASPGDLLIIDEPEKSLHPEAQVKMIEFLAMLVNAGLNIIFTTHSPYVVDHLANLMKAYEAQDKEGIGNEFYLKSSDAFLSKDKISVYVFDQGKATKAIDDDGVIQWNTFGEVSDRLSEIYFKL